MVDNVKDLIKLHEGLRLKPYRCTAGNLTIAYGRNLDDRGVTEQEADYLLENDIADCIEMAEKHFEWFPALDEVRQAVILDMIYNLGIVGLLKFKMMLHFMQLGMYDQASIEMRESIWFDQVKERAKRLCEMMISGKYQS